MTVGTTFSSDLKGKNIDKCYCRLCLLHLFQGKEYYLKVQINRSTIRTYPVYTNTVHTGAAHQVMKIISKRSQHHN